MCVYTCTISNSPKCTPRSDLMERLCIARVLTDVIDIRSQDCSLSIQLCDLTLPYLPLSYDDSINHLRLVLHSAFSELTCTFVTLQSVSGCIMCMYIS